jgi:hypothetical protein
MYTFAISLAFIMATEANLEAQLTAYPPREVIRSQVEFAERFFNYLSEEASVAAEGTDLHKWIDYQEKYIAQVSMPWGRLMDAQDKTNSIVARISSLAELKKLLLKFEGRLPPLVCYWRFHEGPPPIRRSKYALPNPKGA